MTGRLSEQLEDVSQRRRIIERAERRRHPGCVLEPASETLQFARDGLSVHARLVSLAQDTIDRLLKLASRCLFSLSGAFEIPMTLFELQDVLLQVLLDPRDVLPLRVNHLLEGLASRQ
ncbi:MAG TPA: hypothetical protein VFB99_24295 [Vicinamibacterales bacterium]|nr:hypothetical protein [Vicinamibacterales bacterium]